jgi:hypothetical protein
MAIVYTEHAKSRMEHRRILKSAVEDTVLRPYFTVPSRLGRFVAVRRFGDKYLKAVYEKRNGKITVVTVYWTRRP